MKQELRSKYANLLADCIRIAEEETGRQWPETTIICVKSYSPLAELDEILGMKIFVMDMPSEYEFFVAFPAENSDRWALQKVFRDCLDSLLPSGN